MKGRLALERTLAPLQVQLWAAPIVGLEMRDIIKRRPDIYFLF